MLEFLAGIPAVLLIIFALLGLYNKKFAFGFNQKWLAVFLVIGLIAGGGALLIGYGQNILNGNAVASFVNPEPQEGVVSATMLSDCFYASATGLAGNTTIRADPNSQKVVFLDVDGTEYITYSATAGNNINVTFTCVRSGDVEKAGAVEIVVKGDEFRAETSTTDSSIYNIAETSSTPSSIWAGKYRQTLYVKEGQYATTSDSQEYGYLTFAEGEKQLTLGIFGEVDATSLTKLNNYTQKSVNVYQRVDGSDSLLGTIVVNKLP